MITIPLGAESAILATLALSHDHAVAASAPPVGVSKEREGVNQKKADRQR
jgi:hypothetical protein